MTSNPDQANGVTGAMMDAGAEALIRAGYRGVAIATAGPNPVVLDSVSAFGLALARAFPVMAEKAEGGTRDTLLHPGMVGAADLAAWEAMLPAHRAEHVLHSAHSQLLGIAAILNRSGMGNPGQDASLAFMADALTALARQMERAAALQRREQRWRIDAQNAREEMQAAARAAKPKRARPKRRVKRAARQKVDA